MDIRPRELIISPELIIPQTIITAVDGVIDATNDKFNEELNEIKHTCFTRISLFVKSMFNCNCESSSNCMKLNKK